MSPRTFPTRITIDLATFHQDGLQQLAGLLPHENAEQLLKIVISRGLVEMMRSEFQLHPPAVQEIADNMHDTREQTHNLRSQAVRPFPKPSVLYRKRQKAFQEAVEEDVNEREPDPAEVFNDLGQAEDRDTADRSDERYITFPIGDRLHQELESALDEHCGHDEETFYAALLDLGLKTLRERPKVNADLGSPLSNKSAARRKHRAEWKALCRNVARGWR